MLDGGQTVMSGISWAPPAFARSGPRTMQEVGARVAFLFGAARSGTNAVTWRLEADPEVDCINEDNPIAFDSYQLCSIPTVRGVVARSEKKLVFFKSFHDTLRSHQLIAAFPGGRAIYSLREPRATIASFVREFGDAGRHIWSN